MPKFTTVTFESVERFILFAIHSSEMSQPNVSMWAKPMTDKNAVGGINFHRCQKAFDKLELPWPQPSKAKGPGRLRRDVKYVQTLRSDENKPAAGGCDLGMPRVVATWYECCENC